MEFTVDISEVITLIFFFEIKQISMLSGYVCKSLFLSSMIGRGPLCLDWLGTTYARIERVFNLALETVSCSFSLILTTRPCGQTMFCQLYANFCNLVALFSTSLPDWLDFGENMSSLATIFVCVWFIVCAYVNSQTKNFEKFSFCYNYLLPSYTLLDVKISRDGIFFFTRWKKRTFQENGKKSCI